MQTPQAIKRPARAVLSADPGKCQHDDDLEDNLRVFAKSLIVHCSACMLLPNWVSVSLLLVLMHQAVIKLTGLLLEWVQSIA